MGPNQSQKTLTQEIIQLILYKSTIHYQDIMDFTHKSRKTVAKYLDQVEKEVKPLGVSLVRKRGSGIHFTGDVAALQSRFSELRSSSAASEEERQLDIMEYLIQNRTPILLADLADKFFISQRTLDRDLHSLKEHYGLTTQTTPAGIILMASEAEVRQLMAKILQKYWGQEANQDKDGRVQLRFNVPASLRQYVSADILERTEGVLADFINTLKVQVNEYQYESLLIHTTIAMQRIINGDYVPHDASAQLKLSNISPATFKLMKMLGNTFHCEVPIEELEYLNIHIAAIEDGYIDLRKSGVQEQGMLGWLRTSLTNYDETLLDNLVLHLRPALTRVKNGLSIKNPYLSKIKVNFPRAFEMAVDLTLKLEAKFHVNLNEDETSYIALHFESYLERRKQDVQDVKVAIICSTGYGTAELLRQRVRDKLPDVEVVATLSVSELLRHPVDADIYISTIPLRMNRVQVMQVSPFLTEHELDFLKRMTQNIRKEKYARSAFMAMLRSENIIPNASVKTKREAIIAITELLKKNAYVDDEMTNSALEREKLASTVLGDCAIPHGDISHVLKPTIGILTSRAGIQWDQEVVHAVFFVALNQTVEARLDDIYSYFYELIQDPKRINDLVVATDEDAVLRSINVASISRKKED